MYQGESFFILFHPLTPQQLTAYVRKHLPAAWRAVQTPRMQAVRSRLSLTDRALIYHYTDRGFSRLNHTLHAAPDAASLESRGLATALRKLQPYAGLVYSGAYLTPDQLRHFQQCLARGTLVSWPAFLSASTAFGIAEWHLGMATSQKPKNCLFWLDSRTGRDIARFSCYGPNGPKSNEYEVLFAPGAQFQVLEITSELRQTRIILAEV